MFPRNSLKHTRRRFSLDSEVSDDEQPIVLQGARIGAEESDESITLARTPSPRPPEQAYLGGSFFIDDDGGDDKKVPMPVYTTSIPSPYYQDMEWRARAEAQARSRRRGQMRTSRLVVLVAGAVVVVMVLAMVILIV